VNYISLFSGIEAASVAWGPLGWNPVAFSEIEPFCCDLLEKRFPEVPNLGDVSGVDWTEYEGSVDVVIGGSPCQAFSLAGRRLGLMDERGQLMLEFVRCIREAKPRWVIWENVPGVLSQDGGRAFGTLLWELAQCGYALAWRVLDAQFFGVPQRRRRVFLVGHPVPGCAAGVLFEPNCMRGDNPSSREKRALLAADAQRRAGGSYTLKLRHTGSPCIGGGSGPLIQDDVSATLATSQDQVLFQAKPVLPFDTTQVTDPRNGSNPQWGDPCHTMSAQGHVPSVCIGFSAGQSAKAGSIAAQDEVAPTLRASESGTNQVPSVAYAISGNIIGRDAENGGNHLGIEDDGAMFTLTTADRHAVAFSWSQDAGFSAVDECTPTIRAAHSGEPAVCMAGGNAHAAIDEECAGTLKVGGEPPIVAPFADVADCLTSSYGNKWNGNAAAFNGSLFVTNGYIVRRLMPVECERLQGFPDGWTDLGGTPDSPRYKACGNSMAVPVINHIGRRIEAVDAVF
jgi:DNA (cytosine-5)-methyltransferase 1